MTTKDLQNGPERAELRSLLEGGLSSLRQSLDLRQVDALLAFAELLLHWGRTYNLTAIREPREVITHHLLDCLAVVPPLQRELAQSTERRVLDVGSGAGLPGLVIAIADPTIQVVCIDSVGKKTAFVGQAVASLGLRNVEVVHGRVEARRAACFDVIISRAFSSLAAFVNLTEHLLAPDGVWMAMKGKVPAEEIAVIDPERLIHVEPLVVPELHGDRCIVRVQRLRSQ